MSSTHYVARVIIQRVDHIDTESPKNIGTFSKIMQNETKRVTTELANFTVRGDHLVDILTKVPKHLELIDDISAVDPEKPKGTR